MSQVLSLENVVLTLHEEKELQNDGVSDGSSIFNSANAKFVTNGIKKGDRLFVIDKGFFTVQSDPSSETQLEVDQTIPLGNALIYSVARDIGPKIRDVLAEDYSGSGDVILHNGQHFEGYISGTFEAFIEGDSFGYTSRDKNVLKGVTGLGSHSKGKVVWQSTQKPELIFVQNLRIASRIDRVEIPQVGTKYKRKKLVSTDYSIDFTGLFHDLDLDNQLKDPQKEYSIRVFYQLPESFVEDGFNIIGCSLTQEGVTNQDNTESFTEFSYVGAYRDEFVRR